MRKIPFLRSPDFEFNPSFKADQATLTDSNNYCASRQNNMSAILPIGIFPNSSLNCSNVNLVLSYWNGGGCMSSRLNTNPELKSLLATTNPDVFVYAESMVYSTSKHSLKNVLNGYDCFHHTAVKGTCRRGISVFFLEKYRWIMAKTQVSTKYDILWVKMENTTDSSVFCFFYAPGENRQQIDRFGFYDELR